MNNENIRHLYVMLGGFTLLILSFIISYVGLVRFKYCYDNNFKFNYCVKYKNY